MWPIELCQMQLKNGVLPDFLVDILSVNYVEEEPNMGGEWWVYSRPRRHRILGLLGCRWFFLGGGWRINKTTKQKHSDRYTNCSWKGQTNSLGIEMSRKENIHITYIKTHSNEDIKLCMRMRFMKISAVGDNNKNWHRRRRRGMKIWVIGEGEKWVDHFHHLR